MAVGGGNLQKPMETSNLMSSNDSNLNVFEKPNKINKNIDHWISPETILLWLPSVSLEVPK